MRRAEYCVLVLTDGPSGGLGARIRDLRASRGLTQRELAEPRYSRGFLAAVEAGHRVPTDEALAYLADRLGVRADDLRHGRPAGSAEALRADLDEARRMISAGNAAGAADVAWRVRRQADAYHLPELVAYADLCLGDSIQHSQGPSAALETFRRAAQNAPAGLIGATITGRIAGCLYLTGHTAAAIELIESALHEVRARPPVDPSVEVTLLGRLVYPYLEVGARERARRVVDDALALLPRVTDEETVGVFHTVAAQVWDAEGRLSEVDEALRTSREIFARLGFEREIGRCYWTHGYVLVRLDRLEEASEELVRARQMLAPVGARHFHAGATLELAEVRRRQGRLDDAEQLCHEAMDYVTEAGYDEGIAETDRLLGRIALARGAVVEAERLMRLAIERYQRAGLNRELMRTCQELGEVLIGQSRLPEALAVLKRPL